LKENKEQVSLMSFVTDFICSKWTLKTNSTRKNITFFLLSHDTEKIL